MGPDGELYIVWKELATSRIVGRKSVDFGTTFGDVFEVGPVQDNLGTTPPGYWDEKRRHAVYPSSYLIPPNYPALDVDRSSGPRRGWLYAAWTDYAAGAPSPSTGFSVEEEKNDFFAGASPVEIGHDVFGYLRSADEGPEFEGDIDTYRFEGTAGTTISITGELGFSGSPDALTNSLTLYCHRDTLPPKRLASVNIQEPRLGPLPPLVFTLPYSGTYYIRTDGATTYGFNYSFALRTLTLDPGQVALDHRDVVAVCSRDGGQTWSGKVRVNDDPARFDNAFPDLAVDRWGQVQVAWYDRRDDQDCGVLANTYWAISRDGANSFEPSQRLSNGSSQWDVYLRFSTNVGEHLDVTPVGDDVYVVWTDLRNSDPDIFGVKIFPDPTPIAVSGFAASPSGEGVRLSWYVSDASDLAGFRIHRAETGEYQPLSHELRASEGEGEYVEEDVTAERGKTYRYRLEVVHRDGSSVWQGPTEIAMPVEQFAFGWRGAFPNPFREKVDLELSLRKAGPATVQVHDLVGREVATLYRGSLPAGIHRFAWDGRDRGGRQVGAGMYLLHALTGGETASRRLVRVR